MKSVSVAEIKAGLDKYLKTGTEEAVLITRKGKRVALLLALEDEDELERLALAYCPQFQRILDRSEKQIRAGKGIPHKQFWQEVEQSNGTKQSERPPKNRRRSPR